MNSRTEKQLADLKAQRDKLNKKIKTLEKPELVYFKLYTFSPDMKITAFNKLHRSCEDYLNQRYREGSSAVEDHPHYIYEEVMQACLGKDIFKLINILPEPKDDE